MRVMLFYGRSSNINQTFFLQHRESHVKQNHFAGRHWLLLLGGFIQSVPSNYDHFLIYCALRLSSNHS
jgi:hypothetical protein